MPQFLVAPVSSLAAVGAGDGAGSDGWTGVLRRMAGPALHQLIEGQIRLNRLATDAVVRAGTLMNPVWEALAPDVAGIFDVPLVGPARELNERVLRAAQSGSAWASSALELQNLFTEALLRAGERFFGEALRRAAGGKLRPDPRALFNLYLETAEAVFVDMFATDRYIAAQARFVRDGMYYRMKEQEIADWFLKLAYVPTRAEVDQAHRRIYELEKEVRALRRARRRQQGAPDVGAVAS